VPKDTWSVMAPTGSILLPPKPCQMRIFVTFHLSMWTVTTMASMCGNEVRLTSWDEKVIDI
jgi:hypothetical protein